MKVKETFTNARSGVRNKILSSLIPKDIKIILAAVLGIILLIVVSVAVAMAVNKSNQTNSILANEGEKCIPKSSDMACVQDLTCFVPLKSSNAASELGTCIRLPKVAGISAYCTNSTDGPNCENGSSCQFAKDDQFGTAAKCVKI